MGADFYWDLVGDHIIRGDEPTAMSSKLGYLLSGPGLLPCLPSAAVNILHVASEHEQEEQNLLRFWQVQDTARYSNHSCRTEISGSPIPEVLL